jgi:hypothetical protein
MRIGRALLVALLATVASTSAQAQAYVTIDSLGARRIVAYYPSLQSGRWLYTVTLRMDSMARAYAEGIARHSRRIAHEDTGVVPGDSGAARNDTAVARADSGIVRADSARAFADDLARFRDSLTMRSSNRLIRTDTVPQPPGPPLPNDTTFVRADTGVAHADSTASRVDGVASPVRDDTSVTYLGVVELAVDSASYGGVPSWLLTESGTREESRIADSLWLDRSSFRPRHWSSAIGSAGLALEFSRDTIYGATTSPLRRRSIVLAAPGDLLVNTAMTEVLLRLLPLDLGVTDSLSVLVVDVGGAAVLPAKLTVTGEERIVVVAGVYDAWVVDLETERGSATYWVRKDDPVVLRSDQRLPQLGGAILRRELVRTP